jgi:hypothetical protein
MATTVSSRPNWSTPASMAAGPPDRRQWQVRRRSRHGPHSDLGDLDVSVYG